jgi:hypothetical protein
MPSGKDFADWLSPILVKELRQGLKSRVFVSTFIIVQVVMILLVGMQLLAVAGGGGRAALVGFDFFFWLFLWVPLLVLMPARGLTAVSDEVRANTLDLVQLTRLTAFRIVLGKWIALVSQTLLLVAAILPYAMLRYFFGQVDVMEDLLRIGVLLLISIGLTSCMIAFSSFHVAVRIVFFVLLLMGTMATAGAASFTSFSDIGWTIPVFVAVYGYLMLEIAAARIAPISENHAAPKRLLALGLVAIGLLLVCVTEPDNAAMWIAASAAACGWVMLESLCERTVMVPSLYHSYARRGRLGRLAGRMLYPGWASGLLFCSVLLLMMTLAIHIAIRRESPTMWQNDWNKAMPAIAIGFTAVVCPVVVLLWFPRMKQPLWLYMLVQSLFALFYVMAYVVESSSARISPLEAYRWLAPLPTSALFALANESNDEELRFFYSAVCVPVCALIVGYLAFRAVREFRTIAALERESLGVAPGSEARPS